MKYLRGPDIYRDFDVDKATTVISVSFTAYNRYYPSDANYMFVDVINLTKNITSSYLHQPIGHAGSQTIDFALNFAINCDQGDQLRVRFWHSDSGNANKWQIVRNMVVTSDAVTEINPS